LPLIKFYGNQSYRQQFFTPTQYPDVHDAFALQEC
jgi:hypothetical protein